MSQENVGILRDSGGALGEDLRHLAIEGNDKELKKRLKGVANTASADDLGITPLMYAVWNGHVECVKLLVANHKGIDKNGERCSSLELQSNLGYTALHLAALDCPSWSVKEISYLLLLSFEDYSTRCLDGRTAVEIARDESNVQFLDQYEKFLNIENDEVHKERVSHTRYNLASKYTFNMPVIPKRVKTKFALPPSEEPVDDLTAQSVRYSRRMPASTLIPEHELLPLVQYGNEDMRGSKSLKCMKFAIEQAEKNAIRRIGLVHQFDSNCEVLDVSKYVT